MSVVDREFETSRVKVNTIKWICVRATVIVFELGYCVRVEWLVLLWTVVSVRKHYKNWTSGIGVAQSEWTVSSHRNVACSLHNIPETIAHWTLNSNISIAQITNFCFQIFQDDEEMLAVWTKQTTKLPQTQTRVVWAVLRRAWWWVLLQVISHIWQQAIKFYRISGQISGKNLKIE